MLFHCLVALQFIAIAGCLIPSGNGSRSMLVLCLAGAVLGAYTLWYNRLGNFNIYPQVKNSARLIVSGPYRFIRHPMYTSLLLAMLGLVLYNGAWVNTVALAVLAVVLTVKAIHEERFLCERFTGYSEYMNSTRRFVPFLI